MDFRRNGPKIGIVVGLGAEARIARGLGGAVGIGGGTAEGAEVAARALVGEGVGALVSFGLAGGLDPALPPGAVLVPSAILAGGRRWPTDPAIAAELGGADGSTILGGRAVIRTAREKGRLFRCTGAAAVDLESAPVARVAAAHRLGFAALRAVCDPAERDLPPAAGVALSPGGTIQLRPVLASLLRRPGQLAGLLRLAIDAGAARRGLLDHLRRLALIAAASLAPMAAHAQERGGPRQSALCVGAIARAEQRHATPPGLLATIAKVESGRRDGAGALEPWPWTINADGQGYFFPSKEAALDWARRSLANGVQFMDVGCMQVDLQMHPTAFRSLEDAFDPEANADYAARYLRDLRQETGGNWYAAIGLYHSHRPELADFYRLAVAAVGAGLPIPGGGPRTGRPALTRVTLTGGGATMLNLRRQPARVHRSVSPCRIAAVLGSYLRSRPAGCRKS